MTGIDCTRMRGSQSTIGSAIAQVKRSGAVSPAARATASVVPVRMPPNAVGRTTRSDGPPLRDAERVARLAQRGRDEREHLHRRPRDERQHDDRERERRRRARSGDAEPSTELHHASAKTKMPITIDGKPFRTSSHEPDRPRDRARRELADVDRDQHADRQRHRGRDRRRARASRRTRARSRRPVSPKVAGPFVKRSRFSAASARRTTDQTRRASTRDRQQRGERRAASLGRAVDEQAPAAAAGRAQATSRLHQPPLRWSSKRLTTRCAETFVTSVIDEQDQRRGRRATATWRFVIAPWYWSRSGSRACRRARRARRRSGTRSDHLRDGDRLAERAAEPEDDRRDDAARRVRQDDAAHHLPAGRAERRARLPRARAERRAKSSRQIDERDRDDHDRQHERSPANTPTGVGVAAEERHPAEERVQERLDVVARHGAEHEDPPEPDDDARDRGEHARRASRSAPRTARRRELAEEERRSRSRAARRTARAPNDVTTVPKMKSSAPNMLGDRVPRRRARGSASPKWLDRGPRAVDDLVDDRRDDEQRDERGGRGQAVAGASPIRSRRAASRRRPVAGRRGGFHARQHCSRARRRGGPVTTSSHDVHIAVHPAPTGRRARRLDSDAMTDDRSDRRRAPACRTRPPVGARGRLRHRRPRRSQYGKATAVNGRHASTSTRTRSPR